MRVNAGLPVNLLPAPKPLSGSNCRQGPFIKSNVRSLMPFAGQKLKNNRALSTVQSSSVSLQSRETLALHELLLPADVVCFEVRRSGSAFVTRWPGSILKLAGPSPLAAAGPSTGLRIRRRTCALRHRQYPAWALVSDSLLKLPRNLPITRRKRTTARHC